MSNDFNHYPDMDHDGDHDLKDSGMFHEMMGEWETQQTDGNRKEDIPHYANGKKVWPAQMGTKKEDVLAYRITCAIGALVTGVPGLLLLNSEPDNGLLAFITLALLISSIISIKELIFGWPK